MNVLDSSEMPSMNLNILPPHLKQLKEHVWNEKPVNAKLKWQGQIHDVGIAYRGSYTRDLPKKSYLLRFKAGNLGVQEAHLNAEFLDPSMIRNKLSFELFNQLGVLVPEANYVQLFINRKYEGVYLQLESVDQYFLKKRGLPRGAIFYAINNNANFSLLGEDREVKSTLDAGYKRKVGTNEQDDHLRELIYKINSVPRSDFRDEIVRYVDVGKYIQWLVGVICTQNYDGFTSNYALYRSEETGLFELIPWDYDGTWGRNYRAKLMDFEYVPIIGFNTLTARILDATEFRQSYRDKLSEVLESSYSESYLEPIISKLHRDIRPYLMEDPYKSAKLIEFDQEPEYILDFVRNRRQYLLEHLSDLN